MIASSFGVLVRFGITMCAYYISARIMGWTPTAGMWVFAVVIAAIFAVVSQISYEWRRS